MSDAAKIGGNLTGLLRAWSGGDREAGEKVIPLVYDELRRQAARHLRRERAGHSLRPTAVVHEAYLRLMGEPRAFGDRTHFFAVASTVMRHVLVDHARSRGAAKRAGGWRRVTLNETMAVGESPDVDLIALDDALRELAILDPEQARLVEMRYFGGLSIDETAEILGVSPRTVKRGWSSAKAWLYNRITRGPGRATAGSAG